MDETTRMKPEVSVIVTSYNVEGYIERAIRSALDQQGVSVEVIWVDDASSDGTWQTLLALSDPRLRRIRMPVNSGPGAARNEGIRAASGNWLAVLDGDDAFLPGRLARLLARANETRADIVLDNLRVYFEDNAVYVPMFRPSELPPGQMLTLAAFILGNRKFLGGFTFGYFKPVFSARFLREKAIAYDPALRIGEDYILLAEALAEGARCVIDPEEGYLYTARAGSISHRLSQQDVMRITAADKKFLSRHVLDEAAMKAQRQRENSLKEADAFIAAVEAIKRRHMGGLLRALAGCPGAMRHFAGPLGVWRGRMMKRLFSDKPISYPRSVS